MSVGDVTLNVSAILAIMALAVSLLRLLGRRIDPRVPRLLGVLAGVAALASLAFLIGIFMSTDLSYQIVHEYSSEDMPTLYKLSGAWAGKAGSMVLWTSTILIAWMVEELRWWRRARRGDEPREDAPERDAPERRETRRRERAKQRRTLASKQAARATTPPEGWLTLDVARAAVMFIAVLLLVATMVLDPFQGRTALGPEGGMGLNPALRTPLMAIHPPIVFIAYALITLTFGAAVAYVGRGDRNWVLISRPWTRIAWFTLTLGIGIGAMWAYETLGWGGYWSWDPVETSSFVPWVALTAFMHTQVQFERKREYRYLAPFLAGMSMFLVLFATFVTRSGVWASVHAYAGASADTAMERLSLAIADSPHLYWVYIGMWMVGLATVMPPIWKMLRSKEETAMLPERDRGEGISHWLARGRVSMFVTVFIMSVSMALVFLVLITSAGRSVSPDEYNGRLAFFAIPLMAVLVMCMAVRIMGRTWAAKAAGIAIVLGLIWWLVNPGGLDPGIVWFGVVVGMFALLVVLADGARHVWRNRRSPRASARRIGSVLVHMGLAMVFLAYVLSNVAVMDETVERVATEDLVVEFEGYQVKLSDRSWEFDTGVQDRSEYWDAFEGRIEVSRDGGTRSEGPVEVVAEYQYRAVGTLTYVVNGTANQVDGEVIWSSISSTNYWVRVRALNDTELVVQADLREIESTLSPWPALERQEGILRGSYVRVSDAVGTHEGFLVDVETGSRDVVLSSEDGQVTVPGASVTQSSRRAYTRMVMTDVFVHRTPLRDIYVAFQSVSPSEDGTFSATVLVKEVPAMGMLWGGMYLMAAGVVLRPLERLRPRPGRGGGPEDAGHEGSEEENGWE